MGVYDDFIATAQELIDEFGRACWWQKPVAAGTSTVPGYPDDDTTPVAAIPCKIAFFSQRDMARGVLEYFEQMVGSEVLANAQIGLLAGGTSFSPEVTDKILFDSNGTTSTSISKIDVLAPNGTPVLYILGVSA